jgi:hypothetical protein
MDVSKISKGGMVFIGGSILFAIASFLDWFSFSAIEGFGVDVGGNGFDVGFLWCTLWFIVFLAGSVVLALPAFGVDAPKLPAVSFLAAGVLGSLMVILKLLIGEEFFDRSAGLYIAVIGALIVAFGGFLKFTESGGSLSDLTDMNKLKASFSQGGDGATPPPPPPPGMTPPPPPAG